MYRFDKNGSKISTIFYKFDMHKKNTHTLDFNFGHNKLKCLKKTNKITLFIDPGLAYSVCPSFSTIYQAKTKQVKSLLTTHNYINAFFQISNWLMLLFVQKLEN